MSLVGFAQDFEVVSAGFAQDFEVVSAGFAQDFEVVSWRNNNFDHCTHFPLRHPLGDHLIIQITTLIMMRMITTKVRTRATIAIMIIIILKGISIAPIYHKRWEPRPLYSNTNITDTH